MAITTEKHDAYCKLEREAQAAMDAAKSLGREEWAKATSTYLPLLVTAWDAAQAEEAVDRAASDDQFTDWFGPLYRSPNPWR